MQTVIMLSITIIVGFFALLIIAAVLGCIVAIGLLAWQFYSDWKLTRAARKRAEAIRAAEAETDRQRELARKTG